MRRLIQKLLELWASLNEPIGHRSVSCSQCGSEIVTTMAVSSQNACDAETSSVRKGEAAYQPQEADAPKGGIALAFLVST